MLLSVPLVMLVVWPHTYSPFASGKTEIFRLLCMGLCGCMLLTLTVKPRVVPATVWLYGAFVAVLACADFGAAYSKDVALWGEPIEMAGFIGTASYLCYFMALTVLPQSESFWKWMVRGWAISGVVVSIASLMQSLHFLMIYYPVPRAYGLIGNGVFFGDYLALTILFTLWAATESPAWLAALVFQIPVLLMTGSRSAEGAVLLGAFILIPGRLKWALVAAGAAFILYTNGTWHNPIFYDLAYRSGCWKAELVSIGQRPWLGWGQENLRVWCDPEVWNRGHNFAVQALGDAGILGLAAYLAFLAGAFRSVLGKPYAMAILTAYVIMISVEPDIMTTTIPMLSALGFSSWKPA